MKVGHIYTLSDPRTPAVIRYVGMTAAELAVRLRHHLSEARKQRHDYHAIRWIRGLLNDGIKPLMSEVERVPIETMPERERYWIGKLRAEGHRLTNSTDGGEGVINPSEETRNKMRNRVVTTETRAKLSAINTGKRHSPETIAKISRNRKGIRPGRFSDEHRARISDAKKGNQAWVGKHHTEESKHKCSLAKMGNRARLGLSHSDETKRKISESHSGSKSSSAKVTWDDVRMIRAMVQRGITQTEAARIFHITQSTVNSIVRNKTWIDGASAQNIGA